MPPPQSPCTAISRAAILGLALLGLMAVATTGWTQVDERVAQFEFDRLADHVGGRQSTVYDIVEDPFGFIWFAGDTDGILRFDSETLISWTDGLVENNTRANVSTLRVNRDGRLWVGSWGNGLQYWEPGREDFVQFLPDPEDPHGLATARVQRLMIDRRGRLWVGTTGGINLIEPESPERLRRFAHDQPDHPLYQARIWGMVEHASGFWFATSDGLYRLSPDLSQWTHLLLDETAADRFERGAEVRTVAVAHGQIWAGSQLGLFRWDDDADRLVRIEFEQAPERTMPRVNVILESRDGGIWVGAHDGLYRVDERARRFARLNDSYSLIPDVDIRTLLEDSEGNLWIGSRDQGIIHGRRRDFVFMPLAEQIEPARSSEVARLTSAVFHDRQGHLWLGLPGGLLRRDLDGAWTNWTFPATSGVRRVEGFAQGSDERLWIATDSGLFTIGSDQELRVDERLFDALGIGALPITAIHTDDEQHLWLGLWSFGVARWHPSSGQIETGLEALRDTRADLVYQLTPDPNGGLWAATRYSGIFRFDDQGWQAVPITLEGQQHSPAFYCVHPENGEALWLCTEDGLLRYPLQTGRLQRFDGSHGLPANRITGLIRAPGAGDWVLTSRGVARRIPEQNRFVSYGQADGLPGLALQRNAVSLAPNGHIVLGTSNGAVEVDPQRAPRGLNAPRTVLSHLWLDGVDMTRTLNHAQPRLQLAHDHRDLMLQFAVLDFHEPEQNMARYRLRGYEDDFGPLTGNRTIRYMNLPPGEYVLEVEGWSSRGVPGEQRLEIPIRVNAPWWHSPWSWLAAALLLAGLIWLTVQIRLRALKRSNERLKSLVEDRTHELEQANERLKAQSARDFLTGLLNRRGLTTEFQVMERLASRQSAPMALILFDLDHFKQINDQFGHEAGDEVLRQVGEILTRTLRAQDMAARWGGEEFLIVLPNTELEGALQVCEKLRLQLHDMAGPELPTGLKARATFGVVSGQVREHKLESWVQLADKALYDGKRAGRDRILTAQVNPV